jgi:hypothetical protein
VSGVIERNGGVTGEAAVQTLGVFVFCRPVLQRGVTHRRATGLNL